MGLTISEASDKDKVKGAMSPLYVGFEWEFNTTNSNQDNQVQTFIKDKFGVVKGDKSGQSVVARNINVGNAKISITLPEDRYKQSGLVASFYNDGSVNSEIVTRPVSVDKIDLVKDELFKPLRDMGIDFVANGKAGLHMTFLLDPHKELSRYRALHVQNILQLGRLFYPDLINMRWSDTDTKTRGLSYRKLYNGNSGSPSGYLNTLVGQHYDAFSTRVIYDKDGRIERDTEGRAIVWAIEVRIPDGTNNWEEVKAQVEYYTAFFKMAWEVSNNGRLHFSQSIWAENLRWVDTFRGDVYGLRAKGKGKHKMLLTKMIAPFLPKDYKPVGHIMTWIEWANKQEKEGVDNSTPSQ